MAALNTARAATRMLIDFALPPRCPSCGAVTGAEHSFCFDCWQQLTFLGDPACARCGLPFEYAAGEGAECGACLSNPPAYDRLRAAVAYGEVARRVALKLKYSGRPGVAGTLAGLMQRHLAEADLDSILIPVPLHRWRIWRRGYNQAALIAAALRRRTGLAMEVDAMRRVKATPSLRGLGRRERGEAVRGAFRLDKRQRALIAGRPLVLIDDVFTTGATANACARALRRGGATRIEVLCWARVIAGGD